MPFTSSQPGVVPGGGTIFVPADKTWGSGSLSTRAVSVETEVTVTATYLNSSASRSIWVYPQKVTVPWVLEASETDAVEQIRAAGLLPRVVGPSGDPNAWVRTQHPRGGTVVNSGETVTIELSNAEPV